MATDDFHSKPFDEGTLTKLEIFELYTREWLPVFLSRPPDRWTEIHLFDFFAGPGVDSTGVHGSPLRALTALKICSGANLGGWGLVKIHCHFFDEDKAKVASLKEQVQKAGLELSDVKLDIRALPFAQALDEYHSILSSSNAAKLLFIDQFGVDHVSDDVFRRLVTYSTADLLFFISSSTLHRFRDHPAIKQKIVRPDDSYHVHRAVRNYYRDLLPAGGRYFLAPYSIRKGANIYGLVFGCRHPLGLDKFLDVAWQKDRLNGEANFDINRDNLPPEENFLPLDEFRPSKVTAFERALEDAIRAKQCQNEVDVLNVVYDHAVTRQHAAPVLQKLKTEGWIQADFKVPDVRKLKAPRSITYLH